MAASTSKKTTMCTRPAKGQLCIVPENYPIYQALLIKAVSFSNNQPNKIKKFFKVARFISHLDYNLFHSSELMIDGADESILQFITEFIKEHSTSTDIPTTTTPIQYVLLYQRDCWEDDSSVYLQWTGNEAAITKLKEMIEYIYKNTSEYDIDLGDDRYTLEIDINKKYSLDDIKGCQKCDGVFTIPEEFANIPYPTLIKEWDLGDIIMTFNTYGISEHFTPSSL